MVFGAALIEFLTDPLTIALLELVDDSDRLAEAYDAWQGFTTKQWDNFNEFHNAVLELTDDECSRCNDCATVTWNDDLNATSSGTVCDDCLGNYSRCDRCDERVNNEDITYAGGSEYCECCLSDNFTYCEDCNEYIADDNPCSHNCECEPPLRQFTFPANGHGVISQNERLTVELPKGTIDDEGIAKIRQLLWREILSLTDPDYSIILEVLESVGHVWQTKKGNFTRRLSKAFYERGVKLPPGVVSETGNVARAHSSRTSCWHIELTRDLNDSAYAFYNEDSCWWQSYSYSRCALKNWGGLGLRTYDENVERDSPSGRAWVQPLTDDLQPTHNTENAHAYIVYNGYGVLDDYTPARIIAHLTSRTYRKIPLGIERQYVNNDSGYLIADEATCEATESLHITWDNEHSQGDARIIEQKVVVAV